MTALYHDPDAWVETPEPVTEADWIIMMYEHGEGVET